MTCARSYCRRWAVACMLAVLSCIGCTSRPDHSPPADGRLPVFAGIPPVGFLAEQIGGDHVQVGVLVQPGQDPHTFEPTPQQILALRKARLFFAVGLPFEGMVLDKITHGNERLTVVDAAHGIEKRAMADACCCQHGDEEHADHHEAQHADGEPHGALDPHVWLSPLLLKQMAGNMAAELAESDPSHAADYARNLAALTARIDAVHAANQRLLASARGRRFYVFHPAFGYFADAYGLKQVAVEAGGREPTPNQLRELIAQARADHVRVIFIQPQAPAHSVQAMANALGAKMATLNGLAADPLHDIEDIAAQVAQSWQEGPQ